MGSALSSVEDLAGAQGKFAIFIASLLQRAGVTPMVEFADLLGVFAETVAETDPGEAKILKGWAASIRTVGAP